MKKLLLGLLFSTTALASNFFGPAGSGGGGGSGTVTSVGLALPSIFTVSGSPVTTVGTLTGVLATQTANKVFAGPTTGSAAAPTFRLLDPLDIPALSYVSSISVNSPLTMIGTLTPTLSITLADSGHDGYLSSTDWTTFNGKGAPGGTSGQVQYNNAGALGGFGSWNGTTLAITGAISSTTTAAVGTNLHVFGTSILAGDLAVQGGANFSGNLGFYGASEIAQPTGNVITALSGLGLVATPTISLSSGITGTLQAGQFPALTGDVATTSGSLTTALNSNVVTNAKLAQAPTLTLKGNNTGGTANVSDLTVSQVNTMLGNLSNPMTTGGDMIYGGTSGLATRLANGTAGQVLRSTGGTTAPVWTSNPASSVRVTTPSGHGSTNTAIRTYSGTPVTVGTDITFAQTSAAGASATINTTGVYYVSVTDYNTSGAINIGISVNSTQLSTAIQSINVANFVQMVGPSSNNQGQVMAIRSFTAGDVVRPHDNTSANTTVATALFEVVRLL